MKSRIEIRIDVERGCGWRQPGGLYLVGGGLAAPCGRLPLPLEVCPTCGHGIKPARGWTWVDGDELLAAAGFGCFAPPDRCLTCPLSRPVGQVGLLWVGEAYYATPKEFSKEAEPYGVSRRIASVPAGFVIGETWVWLAHRKAIDRPCEWCLGESLKCQQCGGAGTIGQPGVFRAFRPSAIEYVVAGDETEAQIDALARRGVTAVNVVRQQDSQINLFNPEDN